MALAGASPLTGALIALGSWSSFSPTNPISRLTYTPLPTPAGARSAVRPNSSTTVAIPMDPQVHTLRTAVNFQIQQHPWAIPNIISEMDGRVSEEGSLRMKSPGAAPRWGGKRHRTSEEKESDGSDSWGGDEEVKKARPQRRCAWPDEPRLPEE